MGFVHAKKNRGKEKRILFFAAFFLLDAFLDDISYCLYIWNTIPLTCPIQPREWMTDGTDVDST